MSYKDEDIDELDDDVSEASLESEKAQEDEFYGRSSQVNAAGSERRTSEKVWLVAYSDFMTILMVFFLAMFGYTTLAKNAVIETQMTYSEFAKTVGSLKSELGENIQIKENTKKLILELPSQVLFPSGRAKLNAQAGEMLDELAKSIKLVEGDIIVEGHTDSVAIKSGPYPTNWELSAARAFSVIDRLIKRGVPAEKISAWGFGENRPVASNDQNEGRAKNRRIEIVILKKEEAA